MKDTAPHTLQKNPALRFDWTEWLPYLDDEEATLEQTRVLIETLWSIVIAFVDLGWDIKSSPETCGEAFDLKAALEAAVLSSRDAELDREEAGHGK